MDDVEDFLSHYGVKGMKWGVVRSDAQLSRSSGEKAASGSSIGGATKSLAKTEKREVKAKKQDAIAADLNKAKVRTEKQLAKATNPIGRRRLKSKIKDLDKDIETAEQNAAAAREGRMSPLQKKILIGTAVVGGLLVAYGTQRSIQSGQFTSMATKGKAYMNGDPTSFFKKNPKFADPTLSADDIVKNVMPGINPGYGSKWGTNMNCRRATFAYEMRRRGYDVQATRTSKGTGQTILGVINATKGKDEKLNIIGKLTKASEEYVGGVGRNQIDDPREAGIFAALSKQPERSRGELGVIWEGIMPGIPGGGHSVAYEVINGKAHIFDNQTGKEYKPGDSIFSQIQSAAFTRLDNVELNEDFLTKWVR